MKRISLATLSSLFAAHYGCAPAGIDPIAEGGSHRIYCRMRSAAGKSAIGVVGTDIAENRAFIYLSGSLRACGLRVPEVFAVSEDKGCYLQQDLGDRQLFGLLHSSEGEQMTEKAIRALVHLQMAEGIDWSKPFLAREFGPRQAIWDLNYFKYCFLKSAGVEFCEEKLEDDFESLTEELTGYPEILRGLMYRDCQSRNVIIYEGEPWWIDFQGARPGCVLYDVASFLWQAKARFSAEFRRKMTEVYFDELARFRTFDREKARGLLETFVLFRTLQVLGAYGFRGLTEHKAHFITSIPAALRNMRQLIENGVCDRWPELRQACLGLCNSSLAKEEKPSDRLCVEVFSFSYKRGYPTDYSGNGGGFMFDCRALHNPGRYAEYKSLTGRDEPVIKFLEERSEIGPFLENAWKLTDPAIERYISRGFSHLQIGFGCTGGRHRSVYSAEHTARHIAAKFGAKVELRLIHREHGIEETIRPEEGQ